MSDAKQLPDLQSLVEEHRDPAPCVCCQKPTSGRYIGLPACLDCYRDGSVRKFLDQYGELWSADKFLEHLREASETVKSWPEWKREILGRSAETSTGGISAS